MWLFEKSVKKSTGNHVQLGGSWSCRDSVAHTSTYPLDYVQGNLTWYLPVRTYTLPYVRTLRVPGTYDSTTKFTSDLPQIVSLRSKKTVEIYDDICILLWPTKIPHTVEYYIASTIVCTKKVINYEVFSSTIFVQLPTI